MCPSSYLEQEKTEEAVGASSDEASIDNENSEGASSAPDDLFCEEGSSHAVS